jgi:hypothetical protein
MTEQPNLPPAGSPDDFFNGVGVQAAPSFKFNGVGSGVIGKVVDQYRTFVTEPGAPGKPGKVKTYADGNPIPQLNVTLQTELRNWDKVTKVPLDPETKQPKPASEDDGKRRIYIKYDMRRAVGVALNNAGKSGLETDGVLGVKISGGRDVGQVNELPLYEAKYEPPAQNADLWADQGAASGGDDPWSSTGTPAEGTGTAPAADEEPPF